MNSLEANMRTLRLILAIGTLAGIGCGGDVTSEVPIDIGVGIGPVVSNQPDSFSMQGFALLYTGVETHSWPCTSDQAEIGFLNGLAQGSIRLEVYDAAGNLLHDNTYAASMEGGTFVETRPGGAPGSWTLRFTFVGAMWFGAIAVYADSDDTPDSILIGGRYSLENSLSFDLGWPAGPAEVTIGSAISFGAIRVRIWDPTGLPVMDEVVAAPLASAFSGQSAPGAAGIWRVVLDIEATAMAGAIQVSHP